MRADSALHLDIDDLPNDPSALKDMLREMQDSIRLLDGDCDLLEHRLKLELARRYGRRSERRDADHPDQGYLFGEPPAEVPAEAEGDAASADPQEEASEPLESSTPKKRKGRNGRRRLPDHLRREETVLELEEDDRRCHCCSEPMEEIGREVSETLDYKPASLFVRRTIRPKYACQKCHEGVLTAEPPQGPIDRGLPGPGLLAQVVIGKYADHLPLNRQESILARHGLEISRQTLSDWVAAVANLYTPIRDVLKAQILKGPRIFTDDTQVRVLDPERRLKKPPDEKRKEKKGAQKGTLWVYVGDEGTVFDYTNSRSRDGPLRFLEGYRGYLQADGFPGYGAVYRRGGVTEVACMAHARRKFHDARSNDRRRCRYALDRFGELYQIERNLKTEGASAERRRAQRQAVSVPMLETFKAWLDTERARVLPKSPLGGAISYALNRWEALCRYTKDGILEIDNNAAERAIRPIAVGRKNWLFAGSDQGARTGAVLASIVATCRQNDVEPFAYLRDTLSRIRTFRGDIAELAPVAWKAAQATRAPVAAS